MPTVPKTARPEFRNIGLGDLLRYRMPLAAIVSILHRISGALMFLLLPVVLWAFGLSLRSPQGFAEVASVLGSWPMKLVAVVLFWGLAHHFCAGIRHLGSDICPRMLSKQAGRRSAVSVLVVSLLATLLFAIHVFSGA
ncbi:MAG: succinate dehydrogenase, cytochrome b556 subunit [Betaproteobacteria bacterium]|jgi:succinate dehydrogenase cytochrome b subunit|nr:succinate dehydrogenase, cytochrome b556 subunit [Betaproteobacteria bacterium]MBU6511845.1 succinate dehydrogenase, cytochrome b556 subunit [Betaproteobacteria bacterium]MDE1956157.1 succinate dehydrogenase, cytochrome b556 subunit [Betaproteobacteria bacterium]MDE2153456.1 succinate dehydrogenase, cytochrome b556 subunit [Betaproteobacteria bacterium]MDE2479477.1 succinate dehydrogenase, cytochrome b556 subunit [Betaproteobacteria bacterium]